MYVRRYMYLYDKIMLNADSNVYTTFKMFNFLSNSEYKQT